MKCAHCGADLEPNSQFCGRCGKPRSPTAHREGDEKSVHTVRIDEVLSGRYSLRSRLGEGGMGTVYLAHDKELDREVAVKLLAASLVNDVEVVERFEREARLTAKLDHPHVVPVYDVGRHLGRPFMVMKKLEGVTLAGLLREKGGLTADETLKLLKQLAAGLDFIHSKGFIHRDIKAGNIFVGPEGHATLLDFGILRASRANEALTKTGVVMGTPHYMAPEQAMGAKNVDHRVDIYALAVVVFECLTGTLPFDADSELRLIQLQAHAPPPDLLERAPWIAKPIAEVMKRALAKRPEDRFATGGEMVKALEVAHSTAKTQAVPQAQSATAPTQYQGPPAPPGTAPSWRRKSQDDVAAVKPMPTPRPSAPIVQTPLPGRPGAPPPPLTPPAPTASAPRRGGVLVALLLVGAAAALAITRPWSTIGGELAQDAGRALPTRAEDSGTSPLTPPDAASAPVEGDAGEEPRNDAGAPPGSDAGVAPADAGRKPVGPLKGQLRVISVHQGEAFWCEVEIDGSYRGRTPFEINLPPGKHVIRVQRHGFRPQERQINVASGTQTVERFELLP